MAAFLGLTVVVLVVLVVPLGLSFAERERDELLAGVERDAVAIAFFVEDDLDPAAADAGIDLQGVVDGYEARTGGRVVIVDRLGVALADSEPPDDAGSSGAGRDFSSRPEVATALRGEVARGTRTSETLGSALVFVAVPVASGGSIDGAVRITYPTREVDERVRRNWLVLGGIVAVTLVTASAVSTLLARSVSGPLRRLRSATAALGAGELQARAEAGSGPPEVRAVAEAFNRMADQLAELVGSQEAFVADASHELRTPLTALRLRLEMLAPSPERDAALGEVQRMTRLVAALLSLARADQVGIGGTEEAIDVQELLDGRREAWEPLATATAVAVVVDPATPLQVNAVRDRVVQVLDNYLANALDVAPAGSTVRLAATREPEGVALHVIDAGPGLSAAERERAFDRFWRASSTRARDGGSGLGLAIVARLARSDGASTELREAAGGGIDAVVRYPER